MRSFITLMFLSLALGSAALAGPGPVLVELFTSEGCSSCPPADDLLRQLDGSGRVGEAEVIVLSEHVDYWNRLGWADPFSSPAFSQRQDFYASRAGSGAYTPQMVVDGRQELVGSDRAGALRAIAAAAGQAKARVALALGGLAPGGGNQALVVRVDRLPRLQAGESADLVLAITESGLHSQVARGENAGRRLEHTGVVRSLAVLGAVAGPAAFTATPQVAIPSAWNRANLKAVAFVQERRSGRVLGAAAIPLGEPGPVPAHP
jgi:hypothetical protein